MRAVDVCIHCSVDDSHIPAARMLQKKHLWSDSICHCADDGHIPVAGKLKQQQQPSASISSSFGCPLAVCCHIPDTVVFG